MTASGPEATPRGGEAAATAATPPPGDDAAVAAEGCLVLLTTAASLLAFPPVFVIVSALTGPFPGSRAYAFPTLGIAFFGSIIAGATSWYFGHRAAGVVAAPFVAAEGVLLATLAAGRPDIVSCGWLGICATAAALTGGLAAARLLAVVAAAGGGEGAGRVAAMMGGTLVVAVAALLFSPVGPLATADRPGAHVLVGITAGLAALAAGAAIGLAVAGWRAATGRAVPGPLAARAVALLVAVAGGGALTHRVLMHAAPLAGSW